MGKGQSTRASCDAFCHAEVTSVQLLYMPFVIIIMVLVCVCMKRSYDGVHPCRRNIDGGGWVASGWWVDGGGGKCGEEVRRCAPSVK